MFSKYKESKIEQLFHTKFYENLKSQYFNCFSTTEKYLVKVLFQKYKAISAVCLLDKQSVWNVLFSSFHDIKLLYDISYLKFYINFAEKTNGCSFPLASKNTFLKLRFKSTRFFYYKVKSDCLLNKKKKKKNMLFTILYHLCLIDLYHWNTFLYLFVKPVYRCHHR